MSLPCVEIETRTNPNWTVIWLHGLGADGHDFEPIVPQLIDPSWPAIRFVFPHAPIRPVTINNGMAMRAWYDILGQHINQKQDEVGIRQSIRSLDELIERENNRGIPSQHILLAGFSQGGAIVLAGGLRHKHSLGGIIALSTYLPLHEKILMEKSPTNMSVPIFMAHGSHDTMVPLILGTMSRDFLTQLGYAISWYSYPMAHQVCMEEIIDLRNWITTRLK